LRVCLCGSLKSILFFGSIVEQVETE